MTDFRVKFEESGNYSPLTEIDDVVVKFDDGSEQKFKTSKLNTFRYLPKYSKFEYTLLTDEHYSKVLFKVKEVAVTSHHGTTTVLKETCHGVNWEKLNELIDDCKAIIKKKKSSQ